MVEEMNSEATLYRHRSTGAQVMSVVNDDDNKVFGALFKTPPVDSTGVAHILEHSALCGSRDYPLKEPFVELLKGSQQTFLNAMTYPDRTAYPVASCNLADFYNLVDVYLNAVFFPRAAQPTDGPLILAQEGWHYEAGDGKDLPLTCSGVVYNEMKGVYSSPDSVLYKVAQEAMFPDNCYGVDSGGDPSAIPDLTFEQFRDTHATWYHPSNGYFWFAGDDDPLERLKLLDRYISQFERRQVDDMAIAAQPLMASPIVVRRGYEASEGGEGMAGLPDGMTEEDLQAMLAEMPEDEAQQVMQELEQQQQDDGSAAGAKQVAVALCNKPILHTYGYTVELHRRCVLWQYLSN